MIIRKVKSGCLTALLFLRLVADSDGSDNSDSNSNTNGNSIRHSNLATPDQAADVFRRRDPGPYFLTDPIHQAAIIKDDREVIKSMRSWIGADPQPNGDGRRIWVSGESPDRPPVWSNSTSLLIPNRQRDLRTSSSSSGSELCDTSDEPDRQCFSCLQWSCVQGFYNSTLPDCYHDTLVPLEDDVRLTSADSEVGECSDSVCCEESASEVYSCQGYACPTGFEGAFIACSNLPTNELLSCNATTCCEAPTPAPSVPTTVDTPSPSIVLGGGDMLTPTPVDPAPVPFPATTATTDAPSAGLNDAPSPAPSVEITTGTPSPSTILTEAPVLTPAPITVPALPTAAPTPVPFPTATPATVAPSAGLEGAIVERSSTAHPTGAGDSPGTPAAEGAPTAEGHSFQTKSPTNEVIPMETAALDTTLTLSVVSVGAAFISGISAGGATDLSSASRAVNGAAGQSSFASVRQPSSTLAAVVVTQFQFLAMLSLVDFISSSDTGLLHLTTALRWVNLWPSESFVNKIATTRGWKTSLEEGSSDLDRSPATDSNIGSLVFLGNLSLFCGILAGLFVVHISVASGIEAWWMSKERANGLLAEAHRRGIPVQDLTCSLSSTYQNAFQGAPLGLSQWRTNKVNSPDSDLDSEEGGIPTSPTVKSQQEMLAEARSRSSSVWLYFPHIELIFLLFAFEGALAADLAAIRENESSWMVFVASLALILFPVLMAVMAFLTFRHRVRSDALIVFNPTSFEEDSSARRTLMSKVCTSVRDDHSLFAWANTGAWETAEPTMKGGCSEADQFRIGFEPLFIDFTKMGSWFMIFCLLEVAVMACVGVLIDDSVVQLFFFCGLCALSFTLIVYYKPYANSVINTMAACQSFANTVCTAMLGAAALDWGGRRHGVRMERAVLIIELVCLFALAVPIYVDTFVTLVGAIIARWRRPAKNVDDDGRTKDERREENTFVNSFICRAWPRALCSMIWSNLFACVRDTSAGVRRAG